MSERLMSRKRAAPSETVIDKFWAFVRDNPKLATTLAFELGSLAGTAVRNSSDAKKYLKAGAKKVPEAFAEAMPPSIASALKFLPAPKIQPRRRSHTKRPAARKTKHAGE
jgi:hypothetical protein